ncbi:PH domain-containing protein [Candidatus Woesearchaeota archaeon]|jgi:membrane protein YdbS with pleckstrin-like domain|nr:PH domain-containing protein [Candidatus Woesearchaeota archaeon]
MFKKKIKPGSNVLYNFKRSRKAFLLEYFCGSFLLALLVISFIKGIHLKPEIHYLILGLGVSTIASVELSRLMLSYKIMPDKLTVSEGLIKQDKKNIYFHPLGFVPDIDIKQGRMQRILNYGSISVTMGGEQFMIKDLNRPHQIMEIIEDLIEESKHPERKRT